MILISLLTGKKIVNVIEDYLTKIWLFGRVVGTTIFSKKTENTFDTVHSLERDLAFDFLKKCISDSEIKLQQLNVFIDYLNFQLSLRTLNNSLSLSVTRNLNGTSDQDSVSSNLTESFQSDFAAISKHENATIKSSRLAIARSNRKSWSQ